MSPPDIHRVSVRLGLSGYAAGTACGIPPSLGGAVRHGGSGMDRHGGRSGVAVAECSRSVFAEWLRQHPSDRDACARIKHGLVSGVWGSHYTAAKSAFVQDVANRVKTERGLGPVNCRRGNQPAHHPGWRPEPRR
jgi:hypothetical protein